METIRFKFSCTKLELQNALQKHCCLKNPEIDTPEDVAGAIGTLLASKKFAFVNPIGSKCEDNHNSSQKIIVVVESVQVEKGYGGYHSETERAEFVSKQFLEQITELQKMIFGDSPEKPKTEQTT